MMNSGDSRDYGESGESGDSDESGASGESGDSGGSGDYGKSGDFFGTLVSGSGDLGIGHRLDKLIFWKDREISLRKAPKYQRIKSINNQEHKQQGMEVKLT